MQCHRWGNRWYIATTISNFCFRQANWVSLADLCHFSPFFLSCGNWWKLPTPESLSIHNEKTVFSRHSGSSRSVWELTVIDWTGKVPALPSSTTQTEYIVRWSLQFIVRKGNERGRKTQIEDRKQDEMYYHKMQTFKGNYLVIKTYNNPHLPVM